MAITGLRTTQNFADGERPKNYQEVILRSMPRGGGQKAPLYALTALLKKKTVDDPEYNWFEKNQQSRRAKLTGAYTLATSELTLDTGETSFQFRAGDLLRVEHTGEHLFVTADPSTENKISVQRGYAGTTIATLDTAASGVNPYVFCVGSVFEEGSLAPTGLSFSPTKRSNYCQIMRRTFEMTNTALQTKLRTGDAAAEAKMETLELYSIDAERCFFFGEKSEGWLNGKPARTMGGVLSYIPAENKVVADTSTGVDMEQLEEYMRLMFMFGSNEKIGFVGDQALLALNQIVRKNSQFNITSGIKEYGMNVTRLDSPFGSLVLKQHPLFTQISGGTNTSAYYSLNSRLIVLDMADLQYVALKNRDTKYQPKLNEEGVDGLKSGFIGEISLQAGNGRHHFSIANLAVAKKDS